MLFVHVNQHENLFNFFVFPSFVWWWFELDSTSTCAFMCMCPNKPFAKLPSMIWMQSLFSFVKRTHQQLFNQPPYAQNVHPIHDCTVHYNFIINKFSLKIRLKSGEQKRKKKYRTNLIKLIESNTIETMQLNGFQLSSRFLFANVIIVNNGSMWRNERKR